MRSDTKVQEAKKYFLNLLDMLNARFSAELKKEPEKQVQFMYSKFSPIDSCISQNKVALKDIHLIVQTNLIKLYLELDEKDKIYDFFSKYTRNLTLDRKEVEDYIRIK